MFEEELSRARPPPLVEVRPQGRVQRHTVEHIVVVLPLVQILGVPVPQMGNQLVASLLHFDKPISEQVIAVPKISSSSRCSLTVLREPLTAEQLVEVPRDIVAKIRLFEPIADIPALRGPFGT